jgi:hypothetical protein
MTKTRITATINEVAHKAVSGGWPEAEIKHVFAAIARKQIRGWADNMLSEVVRSHNSSRRKK